MKCETVMILWHNKDPIYSVDFHPTTNKFCTTGFDNEIKIWGYTKDKEGHLSIEYLSSLTKHTKPVNVARFSPGGNLLASGSDDGSVVIWKLISINNPTNGNTKFNPTDVSFMKETWSIVTILRVTTDVYDLSWSNDGLYLTTCSTDNSISIWCPLTKNHQQLITEHSHYVQGVSWDPLNEFMVSQSSDGTCRVYRNEKKKKQKTNFNLSTPTTTTAATTTVTPNENKDKENDDNDNDNSEKTTDSNTTTNTTTNTTATNTTQLSDLQLANRRKLQLTIANVLSRRFYNKDNSNNNINNNNNNNSDNNSNNNDDNENNNNNNNNKKLNKMEIDEPDEQSKINKDESLIGHRMYYDERASTFFRRPTWSPDGSLFITPTGKFKESPTSKYISTSYVFSRYIRDKPIVHLPADSPTVVVKFSPIIYKLRDQQQPEYYENDLPNQSTNTTNSIAGSNNKLFNLNYRMIYAISSTDSIILYDTQQTRKPIAIVSNLHYSAITDISWSCDGLVLMITSSDGFCSYISFQTNELGEPLPESEYNDQIKETLLLKQRALINTVVSNDSIVIDNSSTNNKKRKNDDSNDPSNNDPSNNENNQSIPSSTSSSQNNEQNEQNKKQKLDNNDTSLPSSPLLNSNTPTTTNTTAKRRIQPNLIKKY